MKTNGIKAAIVLIHCKGNIFSVLIFLTVTWKNMSFTVLPIMGEITAEAMLIVPVNNAKTVPSIYFGVILAKRTIPGKSMNAIPKASIKNI